MYIDSERNMQTL